jgi:hypothetical protein
VFIVERGGGVLGRSSAVAMVKPLGFTFDASQSLMKDYRLFARPSKVQSEQFSNGS